MKRAVAVFALIFNLFFGCHNPRRQRPHLRPNTAKVLPTNVSADADLSAIAPVPAHAGWQLRLTGIECQFCARAALEQLETVPGVQSAVYIPTPDGSMQTASAPAALSTVTPPCALVDPAATHELAALLAAVAPATEPESNRFPGFVQLTYDPTMVDLARFPQQLQANLQAAGFGLASFTPLAPLTLQTLPQ